MTLLTIDEFNKRVTRYCQLDDTLKIKKDELKCMRQEMNDLHEQIFAQMQNSKIDLVAAGEYGNLLIKTKESKSSINKDIIKEGIIETMKECADLVTEPEMMAERSTECIMNKRDVKTSQCLKRKKKRAAPKSENK